MPMNGMNRLPAAKQRVVEGQEMVKNALASASPMSAASPGSGASDQAVPSHRSA